MYLPQFHTFPENDRWWGKGFTEWTNVRKAKSLFDGHHQPEVPLHQNYYNLLDAKTQIWQAELAQQYGIDGFCYYHYWFSGKLLMEKPMENMLANQAIRQPFCICWANENWTRNWDGEAKKVIMPQNYEEDEAAWEEHFRYLLPFFRDARYIKHNGCPVFIIYKPYLIKNIQAMTAYWRELAVKAGFPGIYLGYQFPATIESDARLFFDFGMEFEPLYTSYLRSVHRKTLPSKLLYGSYHWPWLLGKLRKKFQLYFCGIPDIADYDATWRDILARQHDANMMPGAFTSWDNSPRRGKFGLIYYEATPQKFRQYMMQALRQAQRDRKEFLFINAWNEWGEGAHLEPDEHNGYGYLEAVRDAVRSLQENKMSMEGTD